MEVIPTITEKRDLLEFAGKFTEASAFLSFHPAPHVYSDSRGKVRKHIFILTFSFFFFLNAGPPAWLRQPLRLSRRACRGRRRGGGTGAGASRPAPIVRRAADGRAGGPGARGHGGGAAARTESRRRRPALHRCGPGRAGPPSGCRSARRRTRPRWGSRPGRRPLLLPALLDGLRGRPLPDARGRSATRRSGPRPRASPPAPGRADPFLSGPGPGADGGRAGGGGPEPGAPPGRGGPGEVRAVTRSGAFCHGDECREAAEEEPRPPAKLRAKWRRESEASTQPARAPPPAARGAPPPLRSRGSRAGCLALRRSGTCS